MKRQLLSFLLAGTLMVSTAVPAFAENSGTVTGSAVKTTGSAVNATGSAVGTTGSAVTTTGGIIPKEPMKKLSLEETLKIMTTTGVRAESAALNKKSDLAVAKEYSEKYVYIKDTINKLDTLEANWKYLPPSVQQQILDKNNVRAIGEMAYNAQVAGATQDNKKVMALRRTFAFDNAENNYQADLNQIRQDTINIYNNVLLADDNYKIANDNLAAQEKNLKDINAKKAVGLLTKKDVLQAQSALADAQKEVRSAKTKMDYAHMSLNYLLGYNVLQEVQLTDALTMTSTAAIDADAAVKSALANRNEIRAADYATNIYKLLFDAVKDYPKDSAAYLNAQIKYLNAQKTAKDTRAQIEIDIRNRAEDFADKKAALDSAKALQNYAQEGLRLIKLTNEEGLSTVEDLLNAQVNVYKANLNVAKATSEYNLALEGLKNAQGVGTMRIPL